MKIKKSMPLANIIDMIHKELYYYELLLKSAKRNINNNWSAAEIEKIQEKVYELDDLFFEYYDKLITPKK